MTNDVKEKVALLWVNTQKNEGRIRKKYQNRAGKKDRQKDGPKKMETKPLAVLSKQI